MQRHDGAGQSAERRYKELRKAWQRRMFGRWGRWVVPALLGLVFLTPMLNGGWRTFATSFLVATGAGWVVVQHLAAPDHIQRWQRGAWGEQWTAKELRPLKKEGWLVRHDLQNGRGNRDHIVVGSSVYLLDTKNLADELTLEGTALRVRRIDQPRDSYVMDWLTDNMKYAARSVNRDIRKTTGERVWVHPVVVLWGQFDAEEAEADGVFYVHGRRLRQWLEERPKELDERRRAVVCEWVGSGGPSLAVAPEPCGWRVSRLTPRSSVLACVGCGTTSTEGRGWKAEIAPHLLDRRTPELAVYCPHWTREFAPDAPPPRKADPRG